ncbi:hypothetical protein C8Q77DRAFT_1159523 [Trametes polyzona]|nr:hypothetical protein C8Q77DRAFT_1159523 [Trametes polyzona]
MLHGPPTASLAGPLASSPPIPQKLAPTAPLGWSPPAPKSIVEEILPLVHPDHRHVLLAPDGPILDPQSLADARTWEYTPPEPPRDIPPHYGPRGEILVVNPPSTPNATSSRSPTVYSPRVVAEPFIPLQTGRSPSESIITPNASDAGPSAPDTHARQHPLLMMIEPAVQHIPMGPPQLMTIPAPPLSSIQHRSHPAPRKKRRLAPAPAEPPRERVCASVSCGRRLGPEVRGQFCADCGFLLWRRQFRARVAGLGELVTEEAAPREDNAVKQEPQSIAIAHPEDGETCAPNASAPTSAPSTLPPHTSSHSGKGGSGTPSNSDLPTPEDSTMPRHDLPAVDDQSVESEDDEDDVPLSVSVARKRSTAIPEVLSPVEVPSSVAVDEAPLPVEVQEEKPVVDPPRPRIRLILRGPRTPPPVSPESDDTSDGEPSAQFRSVSISHSRGSSPEAFGHEDMRRRASLMWESDESDLTPLAEMTDMGESEVDPSESEDEAPPTPQDVYVAPQARSPPPMPPPVLPLKHRGICSVSRCMNLIVGTSRSKFCYPCIRRHQRRTHNVVLDVVEDEGVVHKMPPNGDLTGFRKCNRHKCKRLIPPQADYKWKTCPKCRVSRRNLARLRRALPYDIDSEDDEEEDIPLAQVLAIRKAASRAQKARVSAPSNVEPSQASSNAEQKGALLPVVPMFQHFAALLTTFHTRFSEFTVAQGHYLRYKADQQAASEQNARRNTHVFRFDGEYSVVADPSGGLVDAVVHTVLRNVRAALGLTFTPVAVNDGPENSVMAVLRCIYAAHIPVKPPSPTAPEWHEPLDDGGGESSAQPAVEEPRLDAIQMVGELQIIVAWDRRHRFFPGQRILIRFRLVG